MPLQQPWSLYRLFSAAMATKKCSVDYKLLEIHNDRPLVRSHISTLIEIVVAGLM